MQIKDKVALITGASKGIGKATAMALAKSGARTVLVARSEALLKSTVSEISALGQACLFHAADLCEEKAADEIIEKTVAGFGGIDILINNAGVGYFNPISDLSTSDWDAMFTLNIRGLFLMTRSCLPHLRAAGESVIVNIASLAGKNAFIGGGGYAATKHAVVGFSRCLMLEERKNGVRVLLMCPGSVDTNFFAGRSKNTERILKPEDVAESIIHMIKLPQRAMLSEIDIRPTDP
jgi:3-oxoacyl-[acyl-carrier protein] reductase